MLLDSTLKAMNEVLGALALLVAISIAILVIGCVIIFTIFGRAKKTVEPEEER